MFRSLIEQLFHFLDDGFFDQFLCRQLSFDSAND